VCWGFPKLFPPSISFFDHHFFPPLHFAFFFFFLSTDFFVSVDGEAIVQAFSFSRNGVQPHSRKERRESVKEKRKRYPKKNGSAKREGERKERKVEKEEKRIEKKKKKKKTEPALPIENYRFGKSLIACLPACLAFSKEKKKGRTRGLLRLEIWWLSSIAPWDAEHACFFFLFYNESFALFSHLSVSFLSLSLLLPCLWVNVWVFSLSLFSLS
jgi:hypothetical protein